MRVTVGIASAILRTAAQVAVGARDDGGPPGLAGGQTAIDVATLRGTRERSRLELMVEFGRTRGRESARVLSERRSRSGTNPRVARGGGPASYSPVITTSSMYIVPCQLPLGESRIPTRFTNTALTNDVVMWNQLPDGILPQYRTA